MLLPQLLLFTTTALALALPSPTPTQPPTTLGRRSPEQTTDAVVSYFVTTQSIIVDGVTNSHVTLPGKTIELTRTTCSQTAVPDRNGHVPPGSCNAIWDYYPSFVAAVVFVVVFGALMAVHVWQAVSYKKVRVSPVAIRRRAPWLTSG